MTMPRRESPPEHESPQEGGEGTRLTAHQIHDNVRSAAEEELERPAAALLWSGVAAGLAISFSFFAAAFLASLVDPPLKKAAESVGYPLGFVLVVLARQQLFTENTLEPVIPLLDDFSGHKLVRVLRLWALVLVANLAGALLIAVVAARTTMFTEPTLLAEMEHVATQATGGGFVEVFYKAIFAGWLVALMAWLVAATKLTGAQIVLIWLTTAPISAFGFKHSIAGSVEAFWLAAWGGATWSAMLWQFVVPAILGNIVGGVLIVAVLNHGQVKAGK